MPTKNSNSAAGSVISITSKSVYNSLEPTRHFAEVSARARNVSTNKSIQNSAELNIASSDCILFRKLRALA